MAITVAAGDYGYGTLYPAVSPYVTAVGGTTLWMKGSKRTEEKAWSQDAQDGTGSGCSSSLEHQQSWHSSYSSACAYRTDNDVAADADPRTGPAVDDSYPPPGEGLPKGWPQLGGTSASAPVIAGVYALASPGGKPPAGTLATEFPYRATSGLRDITTGSNAMCGSYLWTAGTATTAPPGWACPAA